MWPLLSRCFRIPRRHVYLDRRGVRHVINAEVGVDQGCSGSSPLACLGIVNFHQALSEHCFVAGCQDDTYLVTKQSNIKEALDAVAPALALPGTELNLSKCCVWSPGECDTGSSGVDRFPAVPLVLKQPLLLPSPADESVPQAFDIAVIDKIKLSRRTLSDRLQDLKASGLSTQRAICIARTATSGDSVYLQQCQPLRVEDAVALDKTVLDGIPALLEIDNIENDSNGIAAMRWFLFWRRGGFGFNAVQHSSSAKFLGSWLRDLSSIAEQQFG